MKYKLPNNYLFALVSFTVAALVIFFIRNMIEGNKDYNFLLWNLFLAFLPLLFAWIIHFFAGKLNKIIIIIATFAWLLFYPNAPYMISDLIHVNNTSPVVLYDTLIIFLLAILALFYGFYSLKIIHFIYRNITGPKVANTVVWLSIILSSAGIYLGRILRLNSWDIFHTPYKVLVMVVDHLFPVTKNPSTYALIFLFSIIQFIMLVMMKDLDEIESNRLISGKYGR